MTELQSPWQTFVSVIVDPFNLLQSTVEFFQSWLFTRRWVALLAFSPALLVLGTALTLIAMGAWRDKMKLLQQYSGWIDAETDLSEDGTLKSSPEAGTESNPLMKEENVSPYAMLLLNRVLQLADSNTRATFLVAASLAKQGRVGQARQMMRGLAPTSTRGFAPAHAWLSADRMLRRGVSDREAKTELLHDLEIAATWDGSGPMLLAAYAKLLESEGRIGEAISSLTEAAKREPSLNLELANLAYRNNRIQPLEQASERARKSIDEKIKDGKAVASDYAQLANLLLLEKKTDLALARAQQGLALDPSNLNLKRLASEALRLKYLLTIKNSATGTEVNLGLLDAALKFDPTNPAVTEELARLTALGKALTPELETALNSQLADGKATATTHLLLANRKLASGAIKEAIPHLELALVQAPQAPEILNNLSLALAMTQPEQIPRAIDLIRQALQIQPNNPELHDTLGQILIFKGDAIAAISSYENSIGLDGARIVTRELIIKAYEKAGLKDLAVAQQAAIAKLKLAKPPKK